MIVLGQLSGHRSAQPGGGAWEHAAASFINGMRGAHSQGLIRAAAISPVLVA
jgi:hypothetical protein